MTDLTKYYIDLSKCSEEQRNKIEKVTGFSLIANDYPYLIWLNGRWDQGVRYHIKNRTELTYPEFIKLFEGGEERTELLPDVAYWRYRCLLAEKCLSVSPCDPDITDEQIKAHKDYNQYLETFGKKY